MSWQARRCLALLSAVLLLDQCVTVARPSFVLLGDSITALGSNGPSGWVTQLTEYYSSKADVINKGVSGSNTRWTLNLLPSTLGDVVPQQQQQQRKSSSSSDEPSTSQQLVIWFGANDAVDPAGKDGFRAVPLREFKENLAKMVSEAKSAGVSKVLLVTPPPVNEKAWAKHQDRDVSDRTTERAQTYAEAVRAVGADLNVPVLDMFSLVMALPAGERSSWSEDGLHPSHQGQEMVFEAVKRALGN